MTVEVASGLVRGREGSVGIDRPAVGREALGPVPGVQPIDVPNRVVAGEDHAPIFPWSAGVRQMRPRVDFGRPPATTTLTRCASQVPDDRRRGDPGAAPRPDHPARRPTGHLRRSGRRLPPRGGDGRWILRRAARRPGRPSQPDGLRPAGPRPVRRARLARLRSGDGRPYPGPARGLRPRRGRGGRRGPRGGGGARVGRRAVGAGGRPRAHGRRRHGMGAGRRDRGSGRRDRRAGPAGVRPHRLRPGHRSLGLPEGLRGLGQDRPPGDGRGPAGPGRLVPRRPSPGRRDPSARRGRRARGRGHGRPGPSAGRRPAERHRGHSGRGRPAGRAGATGGPGRPDRRTSPEGWADGHRPERRLPRNVAIVGVHEHESRFSPDKSSSRSWPSAPGRPWPTPG